MKNKELMIKVLVGSRAHKLHNEDSDYDYRGVFVYPTEDILKLGGGKLKGTSWIEGKDDDTSWEIGHFLMMATKCNPTILEVFFAPEIECTQEGKALKELFPYIWNANDVKNAFIGYGLNQRKKLLDNKDGRACKYAVAYLRTLLLAHELLLTGEFTVDMTEHIEYGTLKKWKAGQFEAGEVIQKCLDWQKRVEEVAESCEKETDIDKVNEFLIKIRKNHYEKSNTN